MAIVFQPKTHRISVNGTANPITVGMIDSLRCAIRSCSGFRLETTTRVTMNVITGAASEKRTTLRVEVLRELSTASHERAMRLTKWGHMLGIVAENATCATYILAHSDQARLGHYRALTG